MLPGADGTDGTDGTDGADGAPGPEGAKGDSGAAGPKGDTRWMKMPGRLKVNDITLKTGTIDDTMALHKWRKQVEDGAVDQVRQNGTIWMFNQANEPLAKWDFTNAWPVKLNGPSLNAGANETAVEELTIAVETIDRKM